MCRAPVKLCLDALRSLGRGVSFSWRGEGLIVSSQNHRRTLQVCKMLQCDATTIVKYCNWQCQDVILQYCNWQLCQDVRKQWQSGRAAWARSDVWEILSLPHFVYIRCCHTTQSSTDAYVGIQVLDAMALFQAGGTTSYL